MSDVAIRVENLSKLYHIGKAQQRHDTLRDALVATFKRSNVSTSQRSDENLWALKDVSFEVKRGEVLGIIGRNGAGKSTLLKILSRITEPTEGRAIMHGRVGALLEVGTGFHPELTGRENIYLNGAILGMGRVEIERKFDEIVAFAEIERFLDTPVKRYSSGMYVRLAFAVAAHLEPEVLIVDEVLAVGDAAFQKKCLGKMGDVAKEGRTVLFVSHNMGAITQLCPMSISLRSGEIASIDKSATVVKNYLAEDLPETPVVHLDPQSSPGSPIVLTRCWLADSQGNPIVTVDVTQTFSIGIEILVRHEVSDVEIGVIFYNALGQPLFASKRSDSNFDSKFKKGRYRFFIQMPGRFLAPDTYTLSIGIHRPNIETLDLREHILSFRVEESGSAMWQYYGAPYGNILVHIPWLEIMPDQGENESALSA